MTASRANRPPFFDITTEFLDKSFFCSNLHNFITNIKKIKYQQKKNNKPKASLEKKTSLVDEIRTDKNKFNRLPILYIFKQLFVVGSNEIESCNEKYALFIYIRMQI